MRLSPSYPPHNLCQPDLLIIVHILLCFSDILLVFLDNTTEGTTYSQVFTTPETGLSHGLKFWDLLPSIKRLNLGPWLWNPRTLTCRTVEAMPCDFCICVIKYQGASVSFSAILALGNRASISRVQWSQGRHDGGVILSHHLERGSP